MTVKKTDDWVYLTASDLESLTETLRSLAACDTSHFEHGTVLVFTNGEDEPATPVTVARHLDATGDESLCVAVRFA